MQSKQNSKGRPKLRSSPAGSDGRLPRSPAMASPQRGSDFVENHGCPGPGHRGRRSANRGNEMESDDSDNGDDRLESELDDQEVSQEHAGLSVSSVGNRSRGRPRIPESWTRVISIHQDDLGKLRVYPIATDLQMAPYLPIQPSKDQVRQGSQSLTKPRGGHQEHSFT